MRSSLVSSTRLRLHLMIPNYYQQVPIISKLISHHRLSVNILGAKLMENTNEPGYFDLELWGSPQQIRDGLSYLVSLNLKIIGKPNADGDGWHY